MPIKNLLKLPFFRSSGAGTEGAAARGPAESVEIIRKRAKHRLIGAAVLVLAGVIGFPLLFDTQPRPVSVDIPIDIPDKASVKPLTIPVQPVAQAAPPPATPPAAKTAPAPAPVPVAGSLSPKEEVVAPKKEEKLPKVSASASSPAIKSEAKEVLPADDGRKAKALLEGKELSPAPASAASPAAADGRFVVQVGAFADAAKAHETRLRVEKAGLKTYTQIAETKDGKRIRVRVGPFATKEEADKAAAKIKGLDLPTAILTL